MGQEALPQHDSQSGRIRGPDGGVLPSQDDDERCVHGRAEGMEGTLYDEGSEQARAELDLSCDGRPMFRERWRLLHVFVWTLY